MGPIASWPLLDDYSVLGKISLLYLAPPASRHCATFPGGISAPGLPAITTIPCLSLCLNTRWLPRVRTNRQPSRSMSGWHP